MSNSTPPKQRPPYLRDDEPIALLIAFLAFGAIGAWVYQGYQAKRWDLTVFNPLSTPVVSSGHAAPNLGTQPLTSGFNSADVRSVDSSVSVATAPIAPANKELPAPFVSRPSTGAPQSGLSVPNLTVVPSPSVTPNTEIAPSPESSPVSGTMPPSPTASSIASPSAGFFTDVPSTHWAYPAIKTLVDRRLTTGYPDNTYRPDEPATRAMYAAMIERAFSPAQQSAAKAFKDIKTGDPRSQAVKDAVASNFMTGYPDTTFKPDQKISRTEAIAAMVKGLNLKPPANPSATLKRYSDAKAIPQWAQAKIAAAVEAGLLKTQPNTTQLNPTQPATRADVAALVAHGLELRQP